MKVTKKVLGRLEGEIELKLKWKGGKVEDAFVIAPSYRGFEEVLKGKPILDSVIITPRVCGICGHAHLMASVKAIENILGKLSEDFYLPEKARLIREITLSCELIQNHLRWFYLYFMPDIVRLEPSLAKDYAPVRGRKWLRGLDASGKAIKVIALFGGQWPHTSYAVPGGVTCEPSRFELNQAGEFIRKLRSFLEEDLFGMDVEEYLQLGGRNYLDRLKGDIGLIVEISFVHSLNTIGNSYGRFLSSYGVFHHRFCKFDVGKVKESTPYSYFSRRPGSYSWSKTVRYNGYPCETGPLARRITSSDKLFKKLYRDTGDSVMLRVLARLDEIARLLTRVQDLLERIEPRQESWTKPPVDIESLSGEGIGIVEASRGTLIHRVRASEGRIESYDIITPTVWNLGPRDDKFLGVAEKAMLGVDSQLKAEIVLRSFDVCSVCTSH